MKLLILSIVITWVFIKILKLIISWVKNNKISIGDLFHDGGMPSSHTAAIVSTTTAIFLEAGLTPLFVLSVIVALIVMNDALVVRWVTEEQSRAINKLTQGKPGFNKMNEHVGHKPMEVLVGLILGIIIPVIIYAVL